MLPNAWLEYIANAEREGAKTNSPIKRHQPKVTRNMSPRQRKAMGQTSNTIRAIYTTDSSVTPIASPNSVWTRNLGGSCEDPNESRAKATKSQNGDKGYQPRRTR